MPGPWSKNCNSLVGKKKKYKEELIFSKMETKDFFKKIYWNTISIYSKPLSKLTHSEFLFKLFAWIACVLQNFP